MGILLIGIAALVVGFLLIFLISATAPKPSESVSGPSDIESSHAWLGRLDAQQLGRLLTELFAELKFEVDDARVQDGGVDLFATNPTPITGGRIYIRGVVHPPLGVVGDEEVRSALDTARAEMAGKAFVATGGIFSPEALAAAQGAPLELLDGVALLSLIKKHLPPVAVARRI